MKKILSGCLIMCTLFAISFVSASNSGDFIITVKTNNAGTSNSTSFTFPWVLLAGKTYDVDWTNDGTYDQSAQTTALTHDYGTAGTYQIAIRSASPRVQFNNAGDRLKLLSIDQWGTGVWRPLNAAFFGCANLTSSATDAPVLTGSSMDLSNMFRGATLFNGPIGNWNTSTVNTFNSMFYGATSFNQPIGSWNTSKVTTMVNMFQGATSFNRDITAWNTKSVTTMASMFQGATSFNQAIGHWDTSALKGNALVTTFYGATSFNQSLAGWNTSNVTSLQSTFNGATSFNGDITTWDTSKVMTMANMFQGATSFNQPIGNWNTSALTGTALVATFYGATSFNQPLAGWTTDNVTSMASMFQGATSFDENITTWNTSHVISMANMFYGGTCWANSGLVTIFNQDISIWDTSSVTTMASMFACNNGFNQEIGKWDTQNVTNLSSMFMYNTAFDRPIETWKVSKVTTIANMFKGKVAGASYSVTTPFNQPLSAWDTSSLVDTNDAFSSSLFNQDISNRDMSHVTDFRRMFEYNDYFDQNIGAWDVTSLLYGDEMFRYTKLGQNNYDNLLTNRSSQLVKTGVILDMGSSTYCNASNAHLYMTQSVASGGLGWIITDAGQNCPTTDITLSNTTVIENTTLVGQLSGIDADVSEIYTYILTGGVGDEDNAKFVIVGNTLSFVAAPDYELPTDAGDTVNNNTYSIRVQATDHLGLTFDKVIVITVTDIDEIGPNTPIVSSPLNGAALATTAPSIVGIAESGALVKILDGSGNVIASGYADNSGNYSITLTGLSQGTQSFSVTATDAAGNISPAQSLLFTIDTQIPPIPELLTPSNLSPSTTGTLTTGVVTMTFSGEVGSVITVKDSLGNILGTGIVGPSGVATVVTNLTSLSQGEHTLSITSTDTAGNVSSPALMIPINMDTILPAVPVLLTPNNLSPNTTGTLTTGMVTMTLSGEVGSVITVKDSLGNILGTGIVGPSGVATVVVNLTSLQQGENTLSITSTDTAGNVSSPALMIPINMDTILPAVPVLLTPNNLSPSTTGTLTTGVVTMTFSGEVGSVITVKDSLGNILGTGIVGPSGVATVVVNLTSLQQGENTLSITSTDTAGNVSSPALMIPINMNTDKPDVPSPLPLLISSTLPSPFTPLVGGTGFSMNPGTTGSIVGAGGVSGNMIVVTITNASGFSIVLTGIVNSDGTYSLPFPLLTNIGSYTMTTRYYESPYYPTGLSSDPVIQTLVIVNTVSPQTSSVSSPSVGGAGGGGTSTAVDSCPNGDYSSSYYDGVCGKNTLDKTVPTITTTTTTTTTTPSSLLSTSGEVLDVICADMMNYNSSAFNSLSARKKNLCVHYRGYKNTITIKPTLQKFEANRAITRIEAALTYVRMLEKVMPDVKYDVKKDCSFTDIDGLNREGKEVVKKACQYGFMQGYYDGTFRPNQSIIVQEAITSMYRGLIEKLPEDAPYYAEYLKAVNKDKLYADGKELTTNKLTVAITRIDFYKTLYRMMSLVHSKE